MRLLRAGPKSNNTPHASQRCASGGLLFAPDTRSNLHSRTKRALNLRV